jgi:hypothetical protein
MAQAASPSRPQGEANLAVLYGVEFVGTQIAIDVVSFGCIDASYFSVKIDPGSPDLYRLSIIAQKQDRCRMAPHLVTLTLEMPAVPNASRARFLIMNRFAAPLNLQRSPR